MSRISSNLKFFIDLAKAKVVISRRFDNRLSFLGLGFNDFIILFHLSCAEGEKMRRIDLAEKVGLTPSGVTRQLLPMEKIGLVKREINKHDARVSFVTLAPGGKRLLKDALEYVEVLAQDLLAHQKVNKIEDLTQLLIDLGKTTVY